MYNSAKFWETETPEVLRTSSCIFRYYPIAGRVIVHQPDYLDPRSGEIKPGKGVGFSMKSLAERPEVAKRLIEIIESALPPKPVYVDPEE